MKQSLLITNPLSGGYSRRRVSDFLEKTKEIGLEVLEIELKKDQGAKEIIDNLEIDNYDIIFLAFGDGTINSAINAIAERSDFSKFKICIIPFGTANVLASEVGTDSMTKVIDAVKENKVRKLHLGRVIWMHNNAGRYFALMASSGFDSIAVSKINEKIKSRFGKIAYIKELIRIINTRHFIPIKTHVGKKEYENILTCVSNGKYYGGKIHVADSGLSESSFNVIIIRKFDIASMLEYMVTRKTNKNVIKLKAKNVEIRSNNHNYPLQIDGDCHGNLPIKIESTNKYVNVVYL